MTRNQSATKGDWTGFPVKKRCRILGAVAPLIARDCDQLVALSASDQRTDPVETIASELLPLCAALRFINRRGAKILKTRRLGVIGRPGWLWGVQSEVRRQPFGHVLILGTWNYPVLLPGVQLAQALASGNSVSLKPAPGTETLSAQLVDHFYHAGVPRQQLALLDSSRQAAMDAMDEGVDLVVLTGSADTGRKVLAKAAETLTPTIVELSGCDAVVVLAGSNIQKVAAAIDFGLNFNGGATCVGPRRLLVESTAMADTVIQAVIARLKNSPSAIVHSAARCHVADVIERAIADGGVDLIDQFDANKLRSSGQMHPVLLDNIDANSEIASADLFAPVLSVVRFADTRQAVQIVNGCRYRLAASVFGPESDAQSVAAQLDVGAVTINDLIAPTADPRLPFGGRGESGFGVTRGAEGLLAMTTPTVICVRRGRFTPHLDDRQESDEAQLRGMLKLLHANRWSDRWAGLKQIVSKVKTSQDPDSDTPQET